MYNQIDTVLFDLDGVLVDAPDWHFYAFNLALNEVVQWYIERDDHEKNFNGLPTKVKLRMLEKRGIVHESQFEKLESLKQEKVVEIIKNEITEEDKPKVLLMKELWAHGIKIGCVTNSIRKTTELMLDRMGILQYFDVIITNEDVSLAKPNAEGYITAMDRLQSTPESTVIIEDSPKGIQAAKASGARVIEVKNSSEVDLMLVDEEGII